MLTAQLTIQQKAQKGFTLIELLVVIGILAVLLAIVLIAINPARQFGQANDTKRKSDVQAILNAIGAYAADNHGAIPSVINKDGTTTIDASLLCTDIVGTSGTYISAIPTDPSLNSSAISDCTLSPLPSADYNVVADANSRVTVSAPSAYQGTISITR